MVSWENVTNQLPTMMFIGSFTLLGHHLVEDIQGEQKSWLFRGFVGDDILPSYMGITISQYRDPY